MSPEQASGRHHEIDGRADLFSLAASGFRLVTGRRIHEGGSPVELVSKMASIPAPRIRDVAPQVSASFARVIDRALAFRRDDRYPDAAAMREDVRRAIIELDDAAVPSSKAFAEAPTIVAMPSSRSPASLRPEGTIELSARDFHSAKKAPSPPIELSVRDFQSAQKAPPAAPIELSVRDFQSAQKAPPVPEDARPTMPEPRPRMPTAGDKPASSKRPPAASAPLLTRREDTPPTIRRDEPPALGPPSPRPPALSAREPEGGNTARAPMRSAREPALVASLREDTPPTIRRDPPSAPAAEVTQSSSRRRRPSFIPVITATLLAGIALKLALDAKPSDKGDSTREPPEPSSEVEAAAPVAVAASDADVVADSAPLVLAPAEDASLLSSNASLPDADSLSEADATEEASESLANAASDSSENDIDAASDVARDDDASRDLPHAPAGVRSASPASSHPSPHPSSKPPHAPTTKPHGPHDPKRHGPR
jgi:hypothetical protein